MSKKDFEGRCNYLESIGFQLMESSPFAKYAKFVNAHGIERTLGKKPKQ